ncbi:hypothetical protein F4604DRAFT_2001276 [Suillus subluteus]|nr:hypothetical protein F4604DRAFT_2001276 [Suillus subluteus]
MTMFGLQDHNDFYMDDNILTAFQNYTKQIILRYLNSSAVFSWELANDARCNSTLPTSPTCTTQTVTKWHALMAEFIASIDSNHVVSAGTSGFQYTDCPKLYLITPTASPMPTTSPAPGKKHSRVTPLTKEQIIRQHAESRRQNRAAAKRAGILKEDRPHNGWFIWCRQPHTAPNDPNLDPVQNKINSSLVWIQQSAQSAAVFDLVTQSNLNDYVPFNMTCAPYTSSKVIMDTTTVTDFASDMQQQQGYSSFMQKIPKLRGSKELAAWQLFPSSLPGIANWADVYKDTEHKDPSRNHILIYKTIPNTAPNTVFPVAIRLQGLLRTFRVERFGNWTGQENDALRAVQHLTLSSGGHKKAWDSAIQSINLACEYTSRRLHVLMQGIPSDRDLYLQRCVFMKRDELLKSKDRILKPIDDLEGQYFCIQESWISQCPLLRNQVQAMNLHYENSHNQKDDKSSQPKHKATQTTMDRPAKKQHTILNFDET